MKKNMTYLTSQKTANTNKDYADNAFRMPPKKSQRTES